jgi:hypothetical protein
MPHTLAYNPVLHILEVKVYGDYFAAEARQLLLETLEMIQEHDCFLVLTDLRDAEVKISALEQYDAPELFRSVFAESDIDVRKIKRAVVTTSVTPNYKFAENVVVNRTQRMKVFQDMEEARDWLLA